MKSGTQLPSGVYRFEKQLEIADITSFKSLNILLRKIVSKLYEIDASPIALAASPNRFDDAANYEWQAVRCGAFFSEEGSYCNRYNLSRDLRNASTQARAAYALLQELEAASWRDIFQKAFGVNWSDQSLSLVLQDGLTWLVFSANNVSSEYEGGDPVFAVWDDDDISYFGEAKERFDWDIQNPIPLKFLNSSDIELGHSD